MRQPLREAYACATPKLRWYPTDNASSEFHRLPPASSASFRNQPLKARTGAEKQRLQARARRLLQPMPFFDRHQYCGLDAPPGDDLRTFLERGVQQLAEAGLCILYLPCGQ